MKKILQIILFVFLGIPGALIFVFSSILLIGKSVDSTQKLPDLSILIPACVISIPATLIGIGKLKQWLYSFVFLAFPLGFWLWALINPNMIGGITLMSGFVILLAIGILKAVRHYYEKQTQ